MDIEIAKRIMDIQDQALEDEQFCGLLDEYAISCPRFLDMLRTLTQEQQDVFLDFLGVSVQMHLRLLELALK